MLPALATSRNRWSRVSVRGGVGWVAGGSGPGGGAGGGRVAGAAGGATGVAATAGGVAAAVADAVSTPADASGAGADAWVWQAASTTRPANRPFAMRMMVLPRWRRLDAALQWWR